MGHDGHGQDYSRSSSPWGCTIVTQAFLCMAMYMAFYIGTPMKSSQEEYSSNSISNAGDGRAHEFYFLSVHGGQRPPQQQTHLLKQMEKVAKANKVKFVVNISELGKDDPLLQNGTSHFPSLRVPWYTTISRAKQGQGMGYFLKQAKVPHHRTLDIIGLDTGSLQDLFCNERSSNIENDQLQWLMRTLTVSNSEWRIVVGFHPLTACEEEKHVKVITNFYESLHQIFLSYQVNAYLSKQSCDGHYNHDRGIAYIGNPSHISQDHTSPSVNGSSIFLREMQDGFLLHRVSSLEIDSYFISSASKVIFKSRLHQRGKEVM